MLTSSTNGRPIKFTPERVEQIRNLIERGKSREEIAELVGSTVGSLQVTCSRLGISLRCPKPIRLNTPMALDPKLPVSDAELNGHVERDFEATLRLRWKNTNVVIRLPLTKAEIGQLALEADMSNLKLGQLIVQKLLQAVK